MKMNWSKVDHIWVAWGVALVAALLICHIANLFLPARFAFWLVILILYAGVAFLLRHFYLGIDKIKAIYYVISTQAIGVIIYSCVYAYTTMGEYHSFPALIYFGFITLTTVGYGDITPTPDAYGYIASQCLFGYSTMAIGMGAIVNLLSSSESHAIKRKRFHIIASKRNYSN